MFDDRTVLVTGGAGSFGRRFVETLLERHRPRQVIVFSRDELKHSTLRAEIDAPELRSMLGDVRDRDRLMEAMRGVDVVIHAAAMKQVPAAEYNPMECVKTNVHGAANVIDAAIANGVHRVIALSTCKAASPLNLYGATKLTSDKLFVAANNVAGERATRFSVVRYGNVAGSNGSVVPFFRGLLERGASSLPITDRRMTRFWITLSQGVAFVMRSLMRMQGGEIFVPRLPSVRITDLAEALSPGIAIDEVGIRPGEKLHEVMCPEGDARLTLRFHDHFVIGPSIRFEGLEADYAENLLGERGEPVPDDFVYRSDTNPEFLDVDALRRLIHDDVPA